LQREIIRRDPAWKEGNYEPDAAPNSGMQLARKLGVITYRSAKEWQIRFGRERAHIERKPGDPFGIDFEVESYLENHAVKFTGVFDPNCYLYISRAMDLFDLADYGGSVAEALRRFTVKRALIIGVETDLLFPVEQQQELADGLSAGGCEVELARLQCLRHVFGRHRDVRQVRVGQALAKRHGQRGQKEHAFDEPFVERFRPRPALCSPTTNSSRWRKST